MKEISRLQIREDDLTVKNIANLLREHLENMHEITPPESVHALDIEALRSPDITFWTAWDGKELVGCGALKELDSRSGEIKSMRTVKAHRRRGVASKILEHIIKEAQRRGYDCLNLETGAIPEFTPARALYTRYRFEYRGAALSTRTNELFSHLNDLNCGLPEKIEIFCNSLRDSEACAIGDQLGEACAEAITCY